MDINQILAAAGKMFPSANLQGAVQEAQKAISGTADSLEGVQHTAQRLGIDARVVNSIFDRYGKTMQAKMVCGLLGTTPEALKADADRIVGGTSTPPKMVAKTGNSTTRFPRLK